MKSVLAQNSRLEPVMLNWSPFYLQEVAIMSFIPSYIGLEREELRFNGELGWLAAISFAIAITAVEIFGQ